MTAPKKGGGYSIRFPSARPREKRVAPRYELPIPLTIVHEGAVTRGEVRNISASGIWVRNVSALPPIGSTIRVNVLLMGCDEPSLQVTAEVVRYTDDGGFAAGFVSLDPTAQKALRVGIEGLAARLDDDVTVATWSGQVASRLDPELRQLLACIAASQGRDTRELIRECAHRGLIRFVK